MTEPDRPDLPSFTRVFGRIGLLSFGGPAAQIALMQKELVENRAWLSNEVFLRALSLCMLLPGPEAMQLATYAGWRLRGTFGGLVAGLLFVTPGAIVIFGLAVLYAHYDDLPLVRAAFDGIKAAVIVIVAQALIRLSLKTLKESLAWSLAAGAFVALFIGGVPFPAIILVAGLIGALRPPAGTQPIDEHVPLHSVGLLRVLSLWGGLWAAPVLLVALLGQTFLLEIALFFSKLAVVSFGGAYAVLAYMTQTVVAEQGWIATAQMVDALGLAETTPGPLILVTQFVAVLAGFGEGGTALALAAGCMALWVTFVPCFLWIFLAGPFLDHIARRPRLDASLHAITAAIVGVILNLAIWFAIHVLFQETRALGPIASPLPVLQSLDPVAVGLLGIAAILTIRFKLGVAMCLCVMACFGVGMELV